MSEKIFESEKGFGDNVSGMTITRHAQWSIIRVHSPTYQDAQYHMAPEEIADLTEALLRSLDPETRASVMSVTY